MNLLEINRRIRQRPPFQMIERVTALEPGKSADGVKCVSVNEPYFQGHMPGLPIMPGVLLIESAAQLCSLVIEEDGGDGKVYVLLKVKDFKRLLQPVIDGNEIMEMYHLKPSREVGILKQYLKDAVLDNKVENEREPLLALLDEKAKELGLKK